MFIIFLSFWVIAFFILMNEFRTTIDVWIAITFFCFGFSGVTAFLQEVMANNPNYWYIPAVSASVAMLWGSYGLLIYSLHYTGRMPKIKIYSRMIELLFAIPLISFYFVIPAIQMFGFREPYALQAFHTKVMTGFVTPYYVGSATLLTINLLHKRSTVWSIETIISFILVVPASIIYYLTTFLLPSFGYTSLWQVNIVTIIVESVMFFILVIRKSAFGLFYYPKNATREYMEKSIIEGTGVLHHAMKNNLLAARLSLQNAQFQYMKDNKDSEAIMKDIQLAISSCKHSISILERMHLKTHPVRLTLKSCSLIPLIEQVIDQSLTELVSKNVGIVREFRSDPHVYCDPVHMREVILNLVNNAIEAIAEDESGKLNISLEEVRGKAILKISDNGCGIRKDQMKRVGVPLLTQKVTGTHYGLGLYYVKKVISMHGVHFSLRNAANGGTTAEIRLSAIREKGR